MSATELQQAFEYCKSHTDAEAWDALGMAYYDCGFVLNAGYCFQQADAIREMVPA